jgi:hypothetical protein
MSAEEFEPAFARLDDQLRLDIGEVLREGGHVGVSHALGTKPLALSLFRHWGEGDPDEGAVRGVVARLNHAMKLREFQPYICRERKPAAWALPLADKD